MNGRRWFAVLAVLSLALAGCTAPVAETGDRSAEAASPDTKSEAATAGDGAGESENDASGTGAESQDGGDGAAEDARSLPIDPDPVWTRVATMMDTDAEQPDLTVGVPGATASSAFAPDRSTFKEALNASSARSAGEASGPRGVATPMGVYVEPADGPPAVVEQVLAHEYAHSVQYADAMFSQWLLEPVRSTDQEMVQTALIEGGATYVGDEYTERYLSDVPLQSTQMRRSYERAAAGDRFFVAPYYFGAAYVDGRIDSPANLESVYADPPYNTAELLHGESAGDQLPLSVSADASDGDWEATSRDKKGELYTRVALRATLDDDAATSAAAGWGNDSAVAFDDDGGDPDAFVWALRWRTAADADEFAAAFEESLDRRTDDWAERTTVERVDERTVVVVMGPDEFREGTAVSGSDGDVAVDVDAEASDDGGLFGFGAARAPGRIAAS